MNNQAQRGPNTASVSIIIPTRAEGVVFAPIVMKMNPKPTWKKPATNPKNMSCEEIIIFDENKYPIIMAPIPAINWSGIMSTLGYFLTVNISTAKEIGMTNAAILPIICPVDNESPSIRKIPQNARNIENRVNLDIFSLRKIYPKIAKKIVWVCIIKLAFATVVLYIAKT